jgi:hypothetical protein
MRGGKLSFYAMLALGQMCRESGLRVPIAKTGFDAGKFWVIEMIGTTIL